MDLSNETVIDAGTKASVDSYLTSTREFGGSGTAVEIGTAVIKWAASEAAKAREQSAIDLKKKLEAYKWPAWNDLK